MSLLIDGYNLLHASGILGRGVGRGSLERSRTALLSFLAESLDPNDIPHTTVVFDAAAAPPGLPRTVDFRGISVRYAPGAGDADELLEELIRADSTPRRLTVVSSDHRVQRAAKRRKARAVDSDRWYSEILHQRIERSEPPGAAPASKPSGPHSEGEVQYWLRQFGLWPDAEESADPGGATDSERAPLPPDEPTLLNPFPPGYGEDVQDD